MASGPAVLARIPGADPGHRDAIHTPDEKAQVLGSVADRPADSLLSQIVDVAVWHVDSCRKPRQGPVKALWLCMQDMDPRFRGGDDAQQRLVMPAEAGIHSICGSWQLTLTEPYRLRRARLLVA